MLGSEEEWKSLIDKLDLLKDICQALQMAEWFSKAGLKNLKSEDFPRNPDKDWWSRMIDHSALWLW